MSNQNTKRFLKDYYEKDSLTVAEISVIEERIFSQTKSQSGFWGWFSARPAFTVLGAALVGVSIIGLGFMSAHTPQSRVSAAEYLRGRLLNVEKKLINLDIKIYGEDELTQSEVTAVNYAPYGRAIVDTGTGQNIWMTPGGPDTATSYVTPGTFVYNDGDGSIYEYSDARLYDEESECEQAVCYWLLVKNGLPATEVQDGNVFNGFEDLQLIKDISDFLERLGNSYNFTETDVVVGGRPAYLLTAAPQEGYYEQMEVYVMKDSMTIFIKSVYDYPEEMNGVDSTSFTQYDFNVVDRAAETSQEDFRIDPSRFPLLKTIYYNCENTYNECIELPEGGVQ
jgi:hypothetical protein